MKIRQPVINTMKRVGIDYKSFEGEPYDSMKVEQRNRFSGESCMVHPLIAECIDWVYRTSNQFELEFDHRGKDVPTIADFDRIRYFILEVDSNAYTTCID